MAFSHSVGVIYRSDAGTITNTTDTYTGDGESNFDGTIADTTDQEVDVAFVNSKVKSLVLFSTAAVTIRSNGNHLGSPGAADDVIALAAGKQLVWNTDHVEASPFAAADVVKLFIQNASGGPATVKIRVLKDDTP